MTHGKWISQQAKRYMTLSSCPEHGAFLIRIRLAPDEGETVKVSRLIYTGDSDAAKAYETVKPKVRKRRSRKKIEE